MTPLDRKTFAAKMASDVKLWETTLKNSGLLAGKP